LKGKAIIVRQVLANLLGIVTGPVHRVSQGWGFAVAEIRSFGKSACPQMSMRFEEIGEISFAISRRTISIAPYDRIKGLIITPAERFGLSKLLPADVD
jgi:hypothetical protein